MVWAAPATSTDELYEREDEPAEQPKDKHAGDSDLVSQNSYPCYADEVRRPDPKSRLSRYWDYDQLEFLRRLAWRRNDIIAQWRLACEYLTRDGRPDRDPGSKKDIVEGLVWALLAATNRQSFVIGNGEAFERAYGWDTTEKRYLRDGYYSHSLQRYRMMGRDRAEAAIRYINEEERIEIYNRVAYILSCQEPRGFLRLGYLHEESLAGILRNEVVVRGQLLEAIIPNPSKVEAWKYYILARDYFDPIATVRYSEYFHSVDPGDYDAHLLDRARKLASDWMPPYEFYPTGRFADRNRRDRRYTDECPMTPRRRTAYVALQKIDRVPIVLQIGLKGLHYYKGGLDNSYGGATRTALKRWRRDFFISNSGGNNPDPDENEIFFDRDYLFPRHAVLTVKAAAVSGHPLSQCTLGKMYATGWGVPQNLQRAYYWWIKARAQGHLHSILNLVKYHRVILKLKRDATRAERRAREQEITDLKNEAKHGGGLDPSDEYWCANKLF